MLDAARTKQNAVFVKADLLLHSKIWQISGNEYVGAALRRINHPLSAFVMIRLVTKRNALDLTDDAQSHTALLEAIMTNDPQAACDRFDTAVQDWLANLRSGVFGQLGQATD